LLLLHLMLQPADFGEEPVDLELLLVLQFLVQLAEARGTEVLR